MLIRVVKLEIRPEAADRFEAVFHAAAPHILQMPGCSDVQLLRDIRHPGRYFTISRWDSEADLENYRQSALFRTTWARVKPLFSAPAEAWSTVKVAP